MSADTLRPILAAYRAEVEPHWSAATAHPDYEGAAGSPVGQCGVTSAWLQRRLAEDHGLEVRYCGGHVWFTDQLIGGNHDWLEIGVGPDRIIVDLTANQMKDMTPWPVVCETDRVMRSGGFCYVAHRWPTTEELSVQDRLAILTEAVGR